MLDATTAFNEKKLLIHELCEYMAKKYDTKINMLNDAIDKVLSDTKKYVFDDSIAFLKKLRSPKNKVYLLTYSVPETFEFQKKKVENSGLINFFDEVIITSKQKCELDTDYQNSVFVDDDPKQLLGLCRKNPANVIRIKRKDGKYSDRPLEADVKEVTELSQL